MYPAVATTGDPTNYVPSPEDGFAGIVRQELTLRRGSQEVVEGCTGNLLPDGMHILTAAHCVRGEYVAGDIEFELPGAEPNSVDFVPRDIESITIHPDWTGNWFTSPDLAIIRLSEPAPSLADRYDIYRLTDELQAVYDVVGYGESRQGDLNSPYIPYGTKHYGKNTFDALGDVLVGDFFQALVPGGFLVSDFDGIPNAQIGQVDSLEYFTIDSVVSIVYFWIFGTWNYIFWQEANDEDLFNRFASACGGSLRKW